MNAIKLKRSRAAKALHDINPALVPALPGDAIPGEPLTVGELSTPRLSKTIQKKKRAQYVLRGRNHDAPFTLNS